MSQDWWHDVQSVDLEQHVEHLAQFKWHYDQLSGGGFYARMTELALPRVRAFSEYIDNSTHQCGRPPLGTLAIAMPLTADHPAWVNGMRVEKGERVGLCRDAEVDLCTSAGCELGFVVIQEDVLREKMQRMGTELAVGAQGNASVIQLTQGSEQALRQLMRLVHGNLGVPPTVLHCIEARHIVEDQFILELTEALSGAAPLPEERNALLRKRVVDRARDLMLSTPDESMSILEVCERVGASRRKLNYCFQEVLGTTPVAYMRAIRLNGVRRELLRSQGGVRIYDVAVRWGFWHFSQFSTDYKRQFGELPSHTLLRAKAS